VELENWMMVDNWFLNFLERFLYLPDDSSNPYGRSQSDHMLGDVYLECKKYT